MYRIFDSHVHIYPDKIAMKAAETIADFYEISTLYDGTVKTLFEVGDAAGIEKYLVHSVATAARQVTGINNYIIGECNKYPDRFIGFATMHPGFENPYDELRRAKDAGLKGIKLHPDFQDFEISSAVMDEKYEAARALDLPVLIHTGDSRFNRSNPAHIPAVLRRHPGIKLICAHMGGWSQWDTAIASIKKGDVWVDTSSTMYMNTPEYMKTLINHFGSDHVLFGSDYPMWNVADDIKRFENLKLTDSEYQAIFSGNLCRLLHID